MHQRPRNKHYHPCAGHKATQRSRYTGGDGGGTGDYNDGMKDVTFHTAEWHAGEAG